MPLKILLADDHQLFRQGLASLISSSPLDVHIAQEECGASAWAFIRSHQPDIAVLDISMGDVSGIDVARLVHRHQLPTKIVFLTMHNERKVFQRAWAIGCSGYLLKDEAFDQLLDAIENVKKGREYISTELKETLSADINGLAMTDVLTDREKEIINHIAKGHTNKIIANQLFISVKTVDRHRTNLMKKLGFHNTAQIVKYAIDEKLDV